MFIRLGTIGLVALLYTTNAFACDCFHGGPGRCYLPDAPVAFVGTVISKEAVDLRQPPDPSAIPNYSGRRRVGDPPPPRDDSYIAVTFQVNESLRGDARKTIVIRTEPANNSCTYPFDIGKEYLVFASDRSGSLYTSPCQGTRPANQETALIQQLRFARTGQKMANLFGLVTQPRESIRPSVPSGPAPGITVTAKSEFAQFQTETAADGTYQFMSLPPGRYVISIHPPPSRLAEDSWPWNLGAGVSCRSDVEMSYVGTIGGVVTGRDGPLSGLVSAFNVEADPHEGGSVADVNNGQFKLVRVPPGRYRLRFVPRVNGRMLPREMYFYPGTNVESDAGEIVIGDGEQIDGVKFMIP